MVTLLASPSNVDSDSQLDGDSPSQHIVPLLLELDTILVSESAAESIDTSCVNWEGLVTFFVKWNSEM